MRIRLSTGTLALAVMFLFFGAVNVVLYGGFVRGEDAINVAANPLANEASRAEHDDRDGLPGRFVPNQGRNHTSGWPLAERVPFCDEGIVHDQCYASNPPTSGLHLPVQRNVRVDAEHVIDIPPNPGIYDFEIPRETIPHIQEHAGVFFGYNCQTPACMEMARRARGIVEQELSVGGRIVMAPSGDLPDDTFGLAAWTRVDSFPATDYTDERARAFIKAHSCRFDPEGFCSGGASVN